jgi:oxygen-dependent protoporphyrinogen oxidase
VSGLVAAYRLRQTLGPDARLTVLEQSDRLGGKLRTLDLADVATDVGAEAFVTRDPAGVELVDELGLGDLLVHPERAAATIHAGGTTVRLPKRTFLGVPTGAAAVRDVLSPEGVERVAAESALPPLRLAPDEDASVGELLTARMGREVVDHLVEPLLAGVYAGRADLLGLRATMPALVKALDETGSLTAAAARLLPPPSDAPPKPVFGALRGGMRVLVDELAHQSRADIRLGTTVRGLQRGWRIETGSAPRPEFIDADAVVLAVPPPAARKLLDGVAPDAAAAYGRIAVGSMAVVSMVLPGDVALPDASGVLLAVGERHRDGTPFTAKAFTYTSRKWGGARPRLRASVGRVGEEHTLQRDEDALLADVLADLAELSGVEARPDAWTVTKWGGGLPQYGVGHAAVVAEIERAVAAVPGLVVAGATFRGVGIPACVRTATTAARGLAAELVAG